MKCDITKLLLDSLQRKDHILSLLKLDGLEHIEEDSNGCYCSLPLTAVLSDKRNELIREHGLIKKTIQDAGIKIYDPGEISNPWSRIELHPDEIYDMDIKQVLSSRFLVFTNIGPSTGSGMELQKAIDFNKIPVIITKHGVYTSRMSTGARRCILIEYINLEKQAVQITEIFKLLKEYEPGIGICNKHGNCLVGFRNGKTECLKGLVEEKFPDLKYDFDKYKIQ